MFSYRTLSQRIPVDHPLRGIGALADCALEAMDADFAKLYSPIGRRSIAPERLLRALLLMVLYSIRSERQWMEQLDSNLLFRWLAGLEMDDEVWDVTVFTKNRERLIEGAAGQRLLEAVLVQARAHALLSEEHFTVDGTLIQAWAAARGPHGQVFVRGVEARSFHPKDDLPKPGQGSGAKGAVLLRDKVESSTDPEARLYKKSMADKSVPCYFGHALRENRSGLTVAAEASLAGNAAERELALILLDRAVPATEQRAREDAITLGADTMYQDKTFVEGLRERGIAPHVPEYPAAANAWKNSLTEDERMKISQTKRKLIEKIFGWAKLDRGLRQVKLRGLARVTGSTG